MAKENNNFEATLFNTADKLRKNIDAAEYKNVVLGLIFLKYISDSFLELFEQLEQDDFSDPEDRDEYLAENVFFVPKNARWTTLQAKAKLPEIGVAIDEAMSSIEKENSELKNVLPKQLFYNTGIPATIWILRRGKQNKPGETLFIDASDMGFMKDRVHREFSPEDIKKIEQTYHHWRKGGDYKVNSEGRESALGYEDVKGYCKSAKREEIEKHNFILTPGRYVGIPDEEDDGIPFADKMKDLTTILAQQMQKEKELDVQIKEQLEKVGFKLAITGSDNGK